MRSHNEKELKWMATPQDGLNRLYPAASGDFAVTPIFIPAGPGEQGKRRKTELCRETAREPSELGPRIVLMESKKYQVIYADPPWGAGGFVGRGQIKHYKTMKLSDIWLLPLESIVDKDCVLFLWVIFPRLEEALKLIRWWGFTYKTTAFVWVKRNKCSLGWFWGMGSWTRSNVELCLLATRGNPKRLNADIHQVIDTPVMAHSRKPDEIVRDRITRLCGDIPRVELFARRKVDGWDCWGNEVESDIKLKVAQ